MAILESTLRSDNRSGMVSCRTMHEIDRLSVPLVTQQSVKPTVTSILHVEEVTIHNP